MSDTRHAQKTWNLGAIKPEGWRPVQAYCALLMDIRDELQRANSRLNVLQCKNFLGIPRVLDAIEENTRPHKKPVRKFRHARLILG